MKLVSTFLLLTLTTATLLFGCSSEGNSALGSVGAAAATVAKDYAGGDLSTVLTQLSGKNWSVTELMGESLAGMANDKIPFLQIDPKEQEVGGFAGCNRFSSKYSLTETGLDFGPIASTKMACPDDQSGVEQKLFSVLEQTDDLSFDGQSLLLKAGEQVLAKLAPAAP